MKRDFALIKHGHTIDDLLDVVITSPANHDLIRYDSASGKWINIPQSALGGNPTVLIGLAAVNGSAETFLRSDAAPALDQGIAPTWTGIHTWMNNRNVFSPTAGLNTGAHEDPDVFFERSIKVARLQSANIVLLSYGSTGTLAAPAAVSSLDTLGEYRTGGYDGTGWDNTATRMLGIAAEAWTAGTRGAYLRFDTTDIGTPGIQLRALLTSAGHFRLTSDNKEIQLGVGTGQGNTQTGDLRLFHDGTDSWIRNDTGTLKLSAGAIPNLLLSPTGQSAQFADNATVGGYTLGITAAAGQQIDFTFRTAGVNRWVFRKTTIAESGGNAGSDLQLIRRDDAGAAIANALNIVRSTGAWTIGDSSLVVSHTVFGGAWVVANGSGAGDSLVQISGPSGANRDVRLATLGVNRWLVRANASVESGANVGTDFEIHRRDDAGAQIARALQINRANGNWAIADTVSNPFFTFFGNTLVLRSTGVGPTSLLDGPAATNRAIGFQTAAVARWTERVNSVAESGADAGSDLEFLRFSDAGALLGTALSIKRADGAVTIPGILTAGPSAAVLTDRYAPSFLLMGA